MPLPLYGSGGRMARTSAAIWPTTWRSEPLITISVCVGHATVMPAGMSLTTGCEKPICRFSLAPAAWARKPTPTSVSFFSKPLLTPLTMLLTRARIVPLMALASMLSFAGAKDRTAPSLRISTSEFAVRVRVPLAPLTVIWSAEIDTSTPCGTVIGIFPTRDIARISLGDVAKNFAADAGGARRASGHHALRVRDGRDTQAVHDRRDRVTAAIDAQAGTAHALDALDDGTTCVVLQRDLELALDAFGLDRERVDIALILQNLGDCHLELRRRHADDRLLNALGVANAGQHVGDRITHAHAVFS